MKRYFGGRVSISYGWGGSWMVECPSYMDGGGSLVVKCLPYMDGEVDGL